MEKINDGGPAFTRSSQGPMGDLDREEGMSTRKWFAGQALCGLMANDEAKMIAEKGGVADGIRAIDGIARRCYDLADAMIAWDEKTKPSSEGKS